MNLGIVLEPIINKPPMKANTVPTDTTKLENNDTCTVNPTECKIANIEMIIMSSIIATPKIIVDASVLIISNSSKTRITITVLVTEIARAKNSNISFNALGTRLVFTIFNES